MDPYALIAQMPNAGQAFSDAFQKGQQQNALAAFAQNPGPQTAGAAARYDPGAVLQYNLQTQKDQGAQSQQQLEEWHKYAGNLAQWADTPEKRDQAIDHLLSHNHPDISTEALLALKTIPPEQWQSVRANFMALGGVQDKAAEDPGIIREFDIATQRGLVPQGMSYEQYVQMRNPGMSAPVTIPYGAQVTPGGAAGGGMPSVASPQDAMKLPPGSQFRLPDGRVGTVPGGAGGNASGGFPQ